jgi:hypothetical protein
MKLKVVGGAVAVCSVRLQWTSPHRGPLQAFTLATRSSYVIIMRAPARRSAQK